MEATPQYQFFVLGAIVIAGFTALGWMILHMRSRMKKMFGGMRPSGNTTEDLLRRTMHSEARLDELEPRVRATETAAEMSIQKIGFLRFNPFQDTGGDNSFTMALLDRQNNGVVISSLYMREGTRLYAKEVKNGDTRAHLSDEETQVLEDAMQQTIRRS